MTIEKLTRDNFALSSLDGFVRTQPVTEVYRKFGGEYRLVNEPFTDDWSPARKREKAAEILSGAYIVYGAWLDGRLAGFVMLANALNKNRLIVDSFHVSRDARRHGIGRALFECAKQKPAPAARNSCTSPRAAQRKPSLSTSPWAAVSRTTRSRRRSKPSRSTFSWSATWNKID